MTNTTINAVAVIVNKCFLTVHHANSVSYNIVDKAVRKIYDVTPTSSDMI